MLAYESVFDLRQAIESFIPVWVPALVIFVCVAWIVYESLRTTKK